MHISRRALIFVTAVGPGPFTGALAISVHSIGMWGRPFAKVVEDMDPGPMGVDRNASESSPGLRPCRGADGAAKDSLMEQRRLTQVLCAKEADSRFDQPGFEKFVKRALPRPAPIVGASMTDVEYELFANLVWRLSFSG